MSNPTLKQGPLSAEIGADLEKFRVVALNKDGKIVHAKATGGALGVVTELGRLAPEAPGTQVLAVHYGPAAVKVETDGEIKAGEAVFAAADGKVSAKGSVQVGVAIRATEGGRTLTVLNGLPAAAGGAGASA